MTYFLNFTGAYSREFALILRGDVGLGLLSNIALAGTLGTFVYGLNAFGTTRPT
jgi:hypothetical protein